MCLGVVTHRAALLVSLLLAVVVVLGGCEQTNDELLMSTAQDISALSEEIRREVQDADDKTNGVAAAQALLNERKAVLAPKLARLAAADLGEFDGAKVVQAQRVRRRANAEVRKLERYLIETGPRDLEFALAVQQLLAQFEALSEGRV